MKTAYNFQIGYTVEGERASICGMRLYDDTETALRKVKALALNVFAEYPGDLDYVFVWDALARGGGRAEWWASEEEE